MSEYVWSTQDLLFADGRFDVRMLPGQLWWADDPLVAARPEFFSATPLQVVSTVGRPSPGYTAVKPPTRPSFAAPLTAPKPGDTPQSVEPDDARPHPTHLAETNPVVESVVQSDAPRRGPGRPRKDSRG